MAHDGPSCPLLARKMRTTQLRAERKAQAGGSASAALQYRALVRCAYLGKEVECASLGRGRAYMLTKPSGYLAAAGFCAAFAFVLAVLLVAG